MIKLSKKQLGRFNRLNETQQAQFKNLSAYKQRQLVNMSAQQEKEFLKLNAKTGIGVKEYQKYRQELRQSRAKQTRLKKEHSLRAPKFSYNIDQLDSKEAFKNRRKQVQKTLERDYRERASNEQREQLYGNLQDYFGSDADVLINRFESMSDYELQVFFDSNDDIKRIVYDSDTEILDAIGETFEKFSSRIEIFDNYGF